MDLENLNKNKIPENPLTQRSRFGWLPLVVVSTLLLNLILTIRLNGHLKYPAKNKPYIYVQKVDGSVAVAKAVDELFRDEKTIQQFAKNWLKMGYTWQSNHSNSYVTENRIKYPQALYFASLAIDPEYRQAYLTAVSQRYKDRFEFDDYISGKNQSYIRIFQKPVVKEVERGVWEATVIAYRVHATKNSIFAEEKFNQVIRLRAIEPSDSSEDSQQAAVKNSQTETQLQQAMKELQNQGLQITKITFI